jgi:hypothetical protein
MRSSLLRRRISMLIERLCVVAGSRRRSIIPITFGANVEKNSGTLSSPMQRKTPVPRVCPLLTMARRSCLLSSARTASNSSTLKDGCHRLMARYRAAGLASTVEMHLSIRNEITPISVLLPLSCSALLMFKIGECVAASSCTHDRTTNRATISACSSDMTT